MAKKRKKKKEACSKCFKSPTKFNCSPGEKVTISPGQRQIMPTLPKRFHLQRPPQRPHNQGHPQQAPTTGCLGRAVTPLQPSSTQQQPGLFTHTKQTSPSSRACSSCGCRPPAAPHASQVLSPSILLPACLPSAGPSLFLVPQVRPFPKGQLLTAAFPSPSQSFPFTALSLLPGDSGVHSCLIRCRLKALSMSQQHRHQDLVLC